MKDFTFTHQSVRDLAWACFSAPLMLTARLDAQESVKNCALGLTPARAKWLRQLDEDPIPLNEHIAAAGGARLGIYFESLWHFFLTRDEDTELIAHNLPVRSASRTLGEFDCLYYCRRRKAHVHLELAVKYFLGNRLETGSERQSQWHEWWGPECRDRLDLKVRHLLDRQIKLSETDEARDLLFEMGIGKVTREVEMKGYLFQGIGDPLVPPLGYNTDHPLQQWLHRGKLGAYLSTLGCEQFLLLPKTRWLSPACSLPGECPYDGTGLMAALEDVFPADQRPKLVAALDSNGFEDRRFFVTENDWPQGDGTRN